MYSIVLMTALSTGTAAPDCHWGCWGCGWGWGWGWYAPVWTVPVYPVYPVWPVVVVDGRRPRRAETGNEGVPEPEENSSRGTKQRTARVIVQAPSDATVRVDGVLVPANVRERGFKTPALRNGRQYHYTFTAEVERDGQKVTEKKRVDFRAGSTVTVNFDKLSAGTQAASR